MCTNKKGSLFLGLLMLIVVMGIVAVKLIPDAYTIHKRNVEQEFSVTLGEIRSAMDLERSLGDKSPCKQQYQDLVNNSSDTQKVWSYLSALATSNFLIHANPKDPTIPHYRWGTQSGKLFWQAQGNLVSSQTIYGIGSFEAGSEKSYGFDSPVWWVNSFSVHNNATFSTDTPSSDTSKYDDYPGQNKFGKPNTLIGHSLRLASSTP